MATGVRTGDIISSVFGARHAAKQQEAQGLQYQQAQKAARAKAKREEEDRIFSRAATLFGQTGDAAASKQAAQTGMFGGLTLKKSDSQLSADRKAAERAFDQKQLVDFYSSKEGTALLKQNFPDVDPQTIINAASQLSDEQLDDIVDQINKSKDQSLSQQRINKAGSGGAKSPELIKWKFDALTKSDPVVQQKLSKIDELDANLSANGQLMRSANLSPDDARALQDKIRKDKILRSKYQRELEDHMAKLLDASMNDAGYPEDSDFIEENFDLLFPE